MAHTRLTFDVSFLYAGSGSGMLSRRCHGAFGLMVLRVSEHMCRISDNEVARG